MPTTYNIYKNDGSGGTVDYSTVVANVGTTSYVPSALAYPSDTTFAVRATDGTHEESNVDARVRVVLDATGADISARPSPVAILAAVPLAGGSIRVDWSHVSPERGPYPVGFRVWATAGGTVNYSAAPNTSIFAGRGQPRYHATVAGLTGGVAYSVGVRAYNAAGAEVNTLSAPVVPSSTAPGNVDSLAATATVGGPGPLPA